MMSLFKSFEVVVVITIFYYCGSTKAAYRGPTTAAGITLIKQFEGFRPNFYYDAVGIKTIGYGYACHVNPCGQLNPPLSIAQATSLLQGQLRSFENCVNQVVKYSNLNSAQFSALVSFSYNLGCGSLRISELLRKLNRGDVVGASNEFPKWNRAGGQVLLGLTRRRQAEKTLFCSSGGC